MTSDADILIVGAGVIGCAIARELSKAGARVRVLDARTAGAGATQASAGVLAPYIEADEGGPLLELTARSLTMYERWLAEVSAESGVEIEYARCGTLEPALEEEDARQLQEKAARFAAHARLEWFDRDSVHALEPAFSRRVCGALHVPAHAYVAAQALTDALSRSAERHGAQFETGVRAVGISFTAGGVELTGESGASWGADRVIIAAGSWTGTIDGLQEPTAQDIRPVRGQILRVTWQAQPLTRVVWGPDCYVVPWRDGTVLIGATMEEVGFEERVTAGGVAGLLTAACELLPEMAAATFLEARSGLRPATSDGLPIIGPSPTYPRLVYASGHFRNGILLAPLTAALVAQVLNGELTDPALALVRPDRFR